MSDIIVVGLDREDDGLAALRTLRTLEAKAGLRLEDTAVVSKDPDGTVHLKNELASGTEEGIVVGAILGSIVSFLFPLVGLVGGAVVGGLVGRAVKPGIDDAFVGEVTEHLRPGSAALFVLVKSGDADSIMAAFRTSAGASSRRPSPRTSRRRSATPSASPPDAGLTPRGAAPRRRGATFGPATIGRPCPTDPSASSSRPRLPTPTTAPASTPCTR